MIEAPSQEIFDDIKEKAMSIWRTYDDTYWYATSKIDAIKDIENIRDNAEYIVAMFDWLNQLKLSKILNADSREWLYNVLLRYRI